MEPDLAQDHAAFRDRFRFAPFDHATALGPAPYLSTPEDTGDAFRNALEVMLPVGNPVLPPEKSLCAS